MIDLEKWNKFFRSNISDFSKKEMLDALNEKFTCPRCGRPDLPLALIPHHNKSCAFECAIGEPAIERIERDTQLIDDLKHRIEKLEMAVRDGLTTIRWFGGWLNNRKEPVTYDKYYVPCKDCGVTGEKHGASNCPGYMPSAFSVSYTTRDVARMCNSMLKALGPEASPVWEEFRCDSCQGLFNKEHVHSNPDLMGVLCTWCKRVR